MKPWLQDNNIEMCSTYNEGKSVVAGRIIRTLNNKNYMTSITKNVYIIQISNRYHRTIEVKPVDVNSSIYIDFNKENNEKGPKIKVGDHARISISTNVFPKGYVQNWSEDVFLITKDTVSWACYQ